MVRTEFEDANTTAVVALRLLVKAAQLDMHGLHDLADHEALGAAITLRQAADDLSRGVRRRKWL